ncbi:MAG: DEAD/DEAH box helicase, partial [Bacteroidetes bacterium]|nr:DEAD/DEAH box helicase [Bacteroidota bacterium]
GRDLLGCAQTGTGKTAAFTIPVLQLMHQQLNLQHGQHRIQTLILTPTRELAIQIGESIKAYGKFLPFKHLVVFGGVPQYQQVREIRIGVDILVATPGRLLDLLKQNILHLNNISHFVLDEADRMLDMGFVHDVKRIIAKLPAKKQTLFFSATMPAEIKQLAGILLNNPAKVEVTPVSSTVDSIQQQVYYVDKLKKFDLLVHLLKDENIKTLLVFIQMKHHADKLAKQLNKVGIRTEAIHGDKMQNARQRALDNFKSHKTRVLVATDIAARGIDIDELSHVLNYDLPNVPETYVHRIGRTGRAGAKGIAISFCDWSEKSFLNDIQKLIKKTIPVVKGHLFDNGLMHAQPVKTVQPTYFSNVRRGGKRNRAFMQA